MSDAEGSPRSGDADEADFVAYLARRLGVEAREARERLSAWLNAYEPPPRSGVRRAVPRPECDELEQTG